MPNRLARLVRKQVLLGDIGDVFGFRVLGEQMVERLVLARPHLGRDRLVPFLGIVELRIDIEDRAAERKQPVPDDLSDLELTAGRLATRRASEYKTECRTRAPHAVPDRRHPAIHGGMARVPSMAESSRSSRFARAQRRTRTRRRGNTPNWGPAATRGSCAARNAEVRRALQGKYRWLFVDEFQDTDPVQAEIIFLLAGADPRPCRRPSPTSSAADPDRLAVDPTPSRRAVRRRRSQAVDLPLPPRGHRHLQPRARSAGGATVGSGALAHHELPLRARSVRVGERRLPGTSFRPSRRRTRRSSRRWMPTARIAGAQSAGRASGVQTLTIPASVNKGDVPAAEAERLPRDIRSEVDAGRRSFGDFLVLTRKKKNLARYAGALEALQVPVEVSGAGAFGESEEVAQLALAAAGAQRSAGRCLARRRVARTALRHQRPGPVRVPSGRWLVQPLR